MPKPQDWKIKTDPENNDAPVFVDGKPVYFDPEGKELPLDPVAMYVKISELNKENQGHREKNKELSDTLKIFEGVEDVAKWKEDADKALETVANFNDKDWMKADKVESLKKDMAASYEDKLTKMKESFVAKENDYSNVISKKDAQIRTLLVSNKFSNSPYFSGDNRKANLLPEVAEAYFGKHFKVVEDEKTGKLSVIAYHSNGDEVISKLNPGELAEFDEAIGIIIDSHPQRDHFLRSSGGGSGAGGGSGEDDNDTDELTKLEKQLAKAQESGDVKTAIALKNKIFDLRRKRRAA